MPDVFSHIFDFHGLREVDMTAVMSLCRPAHSVVSMEIPDGQRRRQH